MRWTVSESPKYTLVGVLLAAGAPLGLLLLRRALGERGSVVRQVRRDRHTYIYLATMTPLVFALFGRALGERADHLLALSTTDALTGLANRRGFYPRLREEIERSWRSGMPLSLLLLDLDRFKALNDRYGHAAGDRALQHVANAIRRELRCGDFAGRLGGDECGVIAVNAPAAMAIRIARRMQAALAAVDESALRVTASIGIATFDPSRDQFVDADQLVRSVDDALYTAKGMGRDTITVGASRVTSTAAPRLTAVQTGSGPNERGLRTSTSPSARRVEG